MGGRLVFVAQVPRPALGPLAKDTGLLPGHRCAVGCSVNCSEDTVRAACWWPLCFSRFLFSPLEDFWVGWDLHRPLSQAFPHPHPHPQVGCGKLMSAALRP